MLIGLDRKFVFIANTKTASTSIETALAPVAEIALGGNPARKHVPLHDAITEHPEIFAQPGQWPRFFFKFGVMRDPLDWIDSWFRYRKSNRVESPLPKDMSFAEFWERQDWNFRRADGRPYLQGHMFCGPQGKVLADVIVPYHRLPQMFPEICAALGVAAPLPRENVSRLREAETLTPALEARLRGFYAQDYALFNRLDAINAAGIAWLKARAPGEPRAR
ncbi:MAG: hypothetical protein U5K36_05550 [Roseovarius sp.]|nr:hypothetical protein [Roseovarius sp.]